MLKYSLSGSTKTSEINLIIYLYDKVAICYIQFKVLQQKIEIYITLL